jgi:hypothetical protein
MVAITGRKPDANLMLPCLPSLAKPQRVFRDAMPGWERLALNV